MLHRFVNSYLSGFYTQDCTTFNFDGLFTTFMCKQCKNHPFCGWRTLISSLLSTSFFVLTYISYVTVAKNLAVGQLIFICFSVSLTPQVIFKSRVRTSQRTRILSIIKTNPYLRCSGIYAVQIGSLLPTFRDKFGLIFKG